jgi:hypothetical protein
MHDIVQRRGRRKKRDLAEFHVKRMVLSPEHWKSFAHPTALAWTSVKFTYANVATIPKTRGVYTFLVQPGIANHPLCSYLLYVGETSQQTFKGRYRQYLRDGRAGDKSTRPHITDMIEKWEGFLWFCYAPIKDNQIIVDVEDALLSAYLPPTNKDFPAEISKALRKLFGT